MVGVVQLVRAPDCGSGGRGFESHHSPHYRVYLLISILGRSQVGKARDFDSRIRRFESCRPSHMTHSAGRAPDSPSECPAFESDGSPDKKSEDTKVPEKKDRFFRSAGVAELADALDLGSSAIRRGSSNLFARTIRTCYFALDKL